MSDQPPARVAYDGPSAGPPLKPFGPTFEGP